jgi:hypothetical protein
MPVDLKPSSHEVWNRINQIKQFRETVPAQEPVIEVDTVEVMQEGKEFDPLEKSEVLRTSHKGEHYHDFAIEPIQYIEANHLNFHQGNIVKYVTRYLLKDGIDDLKKARFYLDRLIEITEAGE